MKQIKYFFVLMFGLIVSCSVFASTCQSGLVKKTELTDEYGHSFGYVEVKNVTTSSTNVGVEMPQVVQLVNSLNVFIYDSQGNEVYQTNINASHHYAMSVAFPKINIQEFNNDSENKVALGSFGMIVKNTGSSYDISFQINDFFVAYLSQPNYYWKTHLTIFSCTNKLYQPGL